jgi:hypothetical protein
MKKEEFYVGQRVKIWDADEHCNTYGHVKEIGDNFIMVKWNDMYDPVRHEEEEFKDIKNGTPQG